ncbi:MAG: tetratricopeptide repeat protein [Porticoccaceae bacterium]|nr:MAG: tetratricopeptide repeat protein [Porticoccaceae bacterium]
MIRAISLLVGLCVVLVSGCAGSPNSPSTAATAAGDDPGVAQESPAGDEERDYPVQAFPTQTLYTLLAAETAGLRGDLDFALRNYLEQARITGDPGVIARAVQIAQYAGDEAALGELGPLWADREPDNVQARQLALFALLRQGKAQDALVHATFLLENGDGQPLRQLAAQASALPADQHDLLLAAYADLERVHPDNVDLLFGRALLLWQAGQQPAALALSQRVIQLQPDEPASQLLHTQLLDETGSKEKALAQLEQAVRDHPENSGLSRAYVRMLFSRRDTAFAVKKLEQLTQVDPDDNSLHFGLALAYRDAGLADKARAELELLVQDPELRNDAHFYLGQLAEAAGDTTRAIQHYRQTQGSALLPATARLANLMVQNGKLTAARLYLQELRAQHREQAPVLFQLESELLMRERYYSSAHDLLTESLSAFPGDINLLYARSLASEKMGDIAAVERDLRAILDQDSDNAAALNALGYSLANHSTRYEEAQGFIERALALQPNDGSIMDSLGWVLYRRGQPVEALAQLRRAAALLTDPEVAAHLGEVLWSTGDPEQARAVWREALQQHPDDPLIKETLERLHAGPL